MKRLPFGRTGLTASQLGFGAAPIGYLNTEREKVRKILNLMLDRGVNVIDTAASYEGSEEMIAQAIGHRRHEFVLISKCGTSLSDIDAPSWSPDLIRKTVDRSLRRLRTDRLDVMLLHSCDLQTLQKGQRDRAVDVDTHQSRGVAILRRSTHGLAGARALHKQV
jgi:aryl-alcohol dehydrogenase-like predicted oxidoreductase